MTSGFEQSVVASPPSERVRLRRKRERGSYERETIEAILDEGLIGHLGIVEDGRPLVIPTLHARDGDIVYCHGSTASRTLKALAAGAPACLTVSLIDGLVLARSAMHHSANYRSVVLLGTARLAKRASPWSLRPRGQQAPSKATLTTAAPRPEQTQIRCRTSGRSPK